MSHDLYATWATTEIVRSIKANPSILFQSNVVTNQLTAFANRESGRTWPIPDGRISGNTANKDFDIAIELKRTNEGLHGVLTAIGQSQAYLHKGYNSSIIVIPDSYNSFGNPGNYIANVINQTNNNLPIGVFTYSQPDTSQTSPFHGKLTCHRNVGFDIHNAPQVNTQISSATNTQWAHLREGSSESHAFFKYLQTAKRISTNDISIEPNINHLPQELIDAVSRITNSVSALNYLSFATGSSLHDLIWRYFWFENVLTNDISKLYSSSQPFVVQDSNSPLLLENGVFKKFFSGRSDSIKNKIIDKLNGGTISLNDAWDEFARNIHNRAHSYREDIDSGLSHLGFLEDDGRPTELGYRFIDICERTGDFYSGQAKMILGSSILKNGDLAVLLHYFYKISEEIFSNDNFAFTSQVNGRYSFNKDAYLDRVKDVLANDLSVMNTASIRGGQSRKAFQGELAVLSKFGFIGDRTNRFRIGNGLLINWPLIQEYLNFEI
ncbi:MAG: hypothetical protein KGZ71_02375 [Desulfobulbaceae bacterium]|nr:hypothetical protein [Desulfobulbaceae bacterium]